MAGAGRWSCRPHCVEITVGAFTLKMEEETKMVDPTDSIDMQVLSEINSRTLVNGAALDPALISDALNISSTELTSWRIGQYEYNARLTSHWSAGACGLLPVLSPGVAGGGRGRNLSSSLCPAHSAKAHTYEIQSANNDLARARMGRTCACTNDGGVSVRVSSQLKA